MSSLKQPSRRLTVDPTRRGITASGNSGEKTFAEACFGRLFLRTSDETIGFGVLISPSHVLAVCSYGGGGGGGGVNKKKKNFQQTSLLFQLNGQLHNVASVVELQSNRGLILATLDEELINPHVGVISPASLSLLDDLQFSEDQLFVVSEDGGSVTAVICDADETSLVFSINQADKPQAAAASFLLINDSLLSWSVIAMGVIKQGELYSEAALISQADLQTIINTLNAGEDSLLLPTASNLREERYLSNRLNMRVEEPGEQNATQLISFKQLNFAFAFSSSIEGGGSVWHLASLNIGNSIPAEVFSSVGGYLLRDIVGEGFIGIALIGCAVVVFNWQQFELLSVLELPSQLTTIVKGVERFSYIIGDEKGQIHYTRIDCESLQMLKAMESVEVSDTAIEKLHLITERQLVIVSSASSVGLWDARQAKMQFNLDCSGQAVVFVEYKKARFYIVFAGGIVKSYDLSGRFLREIDVGGQVTCAAFLNSSEIAVGRGKAVTIVNVITNETETFTYHADDVKFIVRVSATHFITADSERILKWTISSNETAVEVSQSDGESIVDPTRQTAILPKSRTDNSPNTTKRVVSPQQLTRFFQSTKAHHSVPNQRQFRSFHSTAAINNREYQTLSKQLIDFGEQ